jgi:hypothetical protein
VILHSTQVSIITVVGEEGIPLEHVNDIYHFETKEEWEDYLNRLDTWIGLRPVPTSPQPVKIRNPHDPVDRVEEILQFDRDNHKFEAARTHPFDQTRE